MVYLSGFGDEISPDLNEQIDVMESEGIGLLEMRSIWGTNVIKLTDEQRAEAKRILDARGVRVHSIGSPLGKIKIDDDFEQHLRDTEAAISAAKYFDAPYIRIFSFFVPKDQPVRTHRAEVIRRLRAMADMAAAAGIVLGHENERDIYGEKPPECRDILDTIASPNLLGIFDPANFVQAGVRPYEEGVGSAEEGSRLLPYQGRETRRRPGYPRGRRRRRRCARSSRINW